MKKIKLDSIFCCNPQKKRKKLTRKTIKCKLLVLHKCNLLFLLLRTLRHLKEIILHALFVCDRHFWQHWFIQVCVFFLLFWETSFLGNLFYVFSVCYIIIVYISAIWPSAILQHKNSVIKIQFCGY